MFPKTMIQWCPASKAITGVVGRAWSGEEESPLLTFFPWRKALQELNSSMQYIIYSFSKCAIGWNPAEKCDIGWNPADIAHTSTWSHKLCPHLTVFSWILNLLHIQQANPRTLAGLKSLGREVKTEISALPCHAGAGDSLHANHIIIAQFLHFLQFFATSYHSSGPTEAWSRLQRSNLAKDTLKFPEEQLHMRTYRKQFQRAHANCDRIACCGN